MSSLPSFSPPPIMTAYNKLDRQFNQIAQQAQRNPVSQRNIQPAWISTLQEQARSPEWNETVGHYVMRTHPKEMQYLRDQYASRTLLLEAKENAKAPSNNYKQLNSSFADLEAQASGMNANSKAVFVGSGPQPNSVLSYSNFAGKVTGVDIDPAAIEATQPIARDSNGRINFALSSGETFDYSGATHVGIAVMVPGKEKVLEQIRRTAPPGCIVIVRSVDGLKNAMYDSFDPSSVKGFTKVATVHGTDKNITHAVILRKNALMPNLFA